MAGSIYFAPKHIWAASTPVFDYAMDYLRICDLEQAIRTSLPQGEAFRFLDLTQFTIAQQKAIAVALQGVVEGIKANLPHDLFVQYPDLIDHFIKLQDLAHRHIETNLPPG